MVDLVALASPLWSRLATVALASALPAISMAQASGLAAPRSGTGGAANSASGQAAAAPVVGPMQLKVRRLTDSVELVIEGAGMAPQLRQSGGATGWQGDLTVASPSGLRVGPQRLSIPELGFQTITFDGSGSNYRIGINPVAGAPLGRPVVSADGQNLILTFPATSNSAGLPVARFNATQPGFIPRPAAVPPLQPRAVAPPLGDMAVGSMTMRDPGHLQLKGPNITLTFRNAPVRDALMAVARIGGYGFVYLSESLTDEGKAYLSAEEVKSRYKDFVTNSGSESEKGPDNILTLKENPRPITVSFANESFSGAVNAILAAGGLQGRLQGRTIFAGPNMLALSTYGPRLSKAYRLNQASAPSAAQFLASLGALIYIPQTITNVQSTGNSTNTGAGIAAGGSTSSSTSTSTSTTTEIQKFGGKNGPLLGVTGTIDSRLSTITLVGDPSIVAIAETYLKQIDLRQRQVALSVKILDVNLSNDSEIDNSFAFRFGNNFIVNDSGRLIGAFGSNLPASSASFDQIKTTTTTTSSNSASANTTSNVIDGANGETFVVNDDLTTTEITDINRVLREATGQTINVDAQTGLPTITTQNNSSETSDVLTTATQNRIARIISEVTGRNTSLTRTSRDTVGTSNDSGNSVTSRYDSRTRPNPGLNYPDKSFYDFIRAQIVSSNTKILASPTLILQEGNEDYGDSNSDGVRTSSDGKIARSKSNESFVRVGTQFVTAYDVKQDINGNNFCQPVFGNAGLTFGARVDKIDDNGFVTFGLSPEISAPVGTQNIGNCGEITLINDRLLDTGKVRVRDGQTLILTGVISETDRTTVSKWPILGDVPLIGQFFRRSSGERTKNELVIMVTPRIIQDGEGGDYGYGYQPGTRYSRELISR